MHKFPSLQAPPARSFFRKAGSSVGKKDEATDPACPPKEPAKLGLFARFRKMYKEYWYVLVPVHCFTSVFWFGGFYYAATTGVDVIAALEWVGVSEKLITPVRDSSLGHIATAYLLYKIATPARYTVTLGRWSDGVILRDYLEFVLFFFFRWHNRLHQVPRGVGLH